MSANKSKVIDRRSASGRPEKIERKSRSVASAALLFKGAARVKAGDTLTEGQEMAALGAELQETAFLVAEFLAPVNDLRALVDRPAAGDRFSPALEIASPWPLPGSGGTSPDAGVGGR